ncbi:hypothetical protein [Neorhizobium sp. JUb45]|uniref:hypothetical protein n=1 Tax=Neorhizobium sp. JUb45 TaxID=2485113 RepID=UPI001FDFD44A|nr:hypothetical protein [Neorhizobium sp. JUb45]
MLTHNGKKKIRLADKDPVDRLLGDTTTGCDDTCCGAAITQLDESPPRLIDNRLAAFFVALHFRTPSWALRFRRGCHFSVHAFRPED